MTSQQRWALAAIGAALASPFASADVTLPALFTDHAVLQKTARVPIWGSADPGETVMVKLAGAVAGSFARSAQATADANGWWRAVLDLSDAPTDALDLEVKGRTTAVAHDLRVGEVWICSGQSNMDWSVARSIHAADIIAKSANSSLRVFVPVRQTSPHPLRDIQGSWQVAAPDTTGGFPAVGYWFGKDLQAALGCPVGLIHVSYGGSPSEAWTSQEGLAGDRQLAEGSAMVRKAAEDYPAKIKASEDALAAWERRYDRILPPAQDPKTYADPGVSTEGWTPVELPGKVAGAGLPEAGVVWLRRTFVLTPEMMVGPLFINLGVLRDFDSFYINGVKVGETSPHSAGSDSPRTYYAEVNTFKPGPVTLALRLVAPAGGAAVDASKEGFNIDTTSLAGTWLARTEAALPAPSPEARQDYPPPIAAAPYLFRVPSYLFNGMLNPVIPYAIKGVVWYQGEDNAPRGYQYRKAFPLMIADWRQHWGQGSFPFYYCQLTRFGPVSPEPEESAWAELREAQTLALATPDTGQAVLIDLGEPGDIHPRDKTLVGDRLARLALKRDYGRAVVDSGPVYTRSEVTGGSIVIHFNRADGGLAAHPLPDRYQPMTVAPLTLPLVLPSPGSQVQGFAISGADRKWVWAQATITGPDTVRVHSDQVPHPVAVRYAWASSPISNLFNGAGLPAGPFRTDDFPETTQAKLYGLNP